MGGPPSLTGTPSRLYHQPRRYEEETLATKIVMPQMGYDMREGTVVKWHKNEGEEVARGEVIADIETDKATVEFEAYTSGVLPTRLLLPPPASPMFESTFRSK